MKIFIYVLLIAIATASLVAAGVLLQRVDPAQKRPDFEP